MSVGWDFKWCPVSRTTTPWHAKDRFTRIRWRVGSRGPPEKLLNSTAILPIRRKTLYNQSIYLFIVVCFYCYFSFSFLCGLFLICLFVLFGALFCLFVCLVGWFGIFCVCSFLCNTLLRWVRSKFQKLFLIPIFLCSTTITDLYTSLRRYQFL